MPFVSCVKLYICMELEIKKENIITSNMVENDKMHTVTVHTFADGSYFVVQSVQYNADWYTDIAYG